MYDKKCAISYIVHFAHFFAVFESNVRGTLRQILSLLLQKQPRQLFSSLDLLFLWGNSRNSSQLSTIFIPKHKKEGWSNQNRAVLYTEPIPNWVDNCTKPNQVYFYFSEYWKSCNDGQKCVRWNTRTSNERFKGPIFTTTCQIWWSI